MLGLSAEEEMGQRVEKGVKVEMRKVSPCHARPIHAPRWAFIAWKQPDRAAANGRVFLGVLTSESAPRVPPTCAWCQVA
ncbi:hypothetical protein CEXT_417331 [Caerostris extrusa]|uniref:Uncharacterized protein n=1 Tax=Caerostris extrusa TaxID=172846 RepID=A0AAV4MZ35_CAEEX|nr:hypothetical protein CEXT_417331 [Caerostris extrusa]